MDFFAHQDRARRQTGRLVGLYLVAVAGIIVAIYFAVMLIFSRTGALANAAGWSWWDPRAFAGVAGGTLALVGCASGYKVAALRGGGETVASALGGRPVPSHTRDPVERQFLNVVEEMALAAGTPVPSVYILPDEPGINAFAAGYAPNNAVVAVTRGCVEQLTRDELQGVVAHEFSHILNGDMRLNIRLMGVLFGILVIAQTGYYILRFGGRGGVRSSGGGKGGGGAAAVLVFGLALMLIGYIGVFVARCIKSAVSRQREFLADASAVQFTRNPDGIAGALKRIGGWATGSRVQHPGAEEASHFFFSDGIRHFFGGMFATHPPLAERIRRIDPTFDGTLAPVQDTGSAERGRIRATEPPLEVPLPAASDAADARFVGAVAPGPGAARQAAGAVTFAAAPAAVIAQVGAPRMAHVAHARGVVAGIPPRLSAAARQPFGARAVVYALLLDSDESVGMRQVARLRESADALVYTETQALVPFLAELGPAARLPLVDLALPALRDLSPGQYARFRQNVRALIGADEQVSVFEFTLQRVIVRSLDPHHGRAPKAPPIRYRRLADVADACGDLLAVLALVGHADLVTAEDAYQAGGRELPGIRLPGFAVTRPQARSGLHEALECLAQAAPAVKKQALRACVACIQTDGRVSIKEAELLRAVADSLDCPLPPFLPDAAAGA